MKDELERKLGKFFVVRKRYSFEVVRYFIIIINISRLRVLVL